MSLWLAAGYCCFEICETAKLVAVNVCLRDMQMFQLWVRKKNQPVYAVVVGSVT